MTKEELNELTTIFKESEVFSRFIRDTYGITCITAFFGGKKDEMGDKLLLSAPENIIYAIYNERKSKDLAGKREKYIEIKFKDKWIRVVSIPFYTYFTEIDDNSRITRGSNYLEISQSKVDHVVYDHLNYRREKMIVFDNERFRRALLLMGMDHLLKKFLLTPINIGSEEEPEFLTMFEIIKKENTISREVLSRGDYNYYGFEAFLNILYYLPKIISIGLNKTLHEKVAAVLKSKDPESKLTGADVNSVLSYIQFGINYFKDNKIDFNSEKEYIRQLTNGFINE